MQPEDIEKNNMKTVPAKSCNWEKLFSTDRIKCFVKCASSVTPVCPRYKCVHFYLYNLEPETSPLLSAEEEADQIQFEGR